jgi:hypothetical protein
MAIIFVTAINTMNNRRYRKGTEENDARNLKLWAL